MIDDGSRMGFSAESNRARQKEYVKPCDRSQCKHEARIEDVDSLLLAGPDETG